MLGLACLLYLGWKNGLREQARIEQLGFHAEAVVRFYREEYVRVAGSWDWLEYPYVEYTDEHGDVKLERLKYAQRPGQPFSIGQPVEVIRYKEILYYRQGLQEGSTVSLLLAVATLVGGLSMIIQSF
ncbi:hypothetical protein B0919_10445 [Hymenobacter sp. CRA2]|nr:hypothetical protein B0919_10445 [Hymenobacter sp. CRA2]